MNHYNSHITTTNNNSNSSFSSSLLEEIYRSFDNDNDNDNNNNNNKIGNISQSKKAKMSNYNSKRSSNGFYDDVASNFNAKQKHSRDQIDRYVLQQWMEKEKLKENTVKLRRNSMPEDGNFRRNLYSSSSTSSSDSSSGIGGFSSSDTDSFTGAPTRMKSKAPSLKPIRTVTSSPEFGRKSYSDGTSANKKSKKDGKLHHALKLYGELKKVKQPISPGGKLATFLNSLFNSGNSKKTKIESVTSSSVVLTSSSVPSTATSYSRSCLSKTPSSAGRYERRSVRFCPVNVVVDETGQKSVYNEDVSKAEVYNDVDLKTKILEKQKRVEEVAKELLKNYRNNNNNNNINHSRKELKVNVIENNSKFGYNGNNINIQCFDDEDEDGEESCCSSDLFELDNLLEIGVDDHELPVYETTHVKTNRAIANRSIL